MTRKQILVTTLLVVLIAAATWIAYRPALHSGFLNWDDPDTVTGNEHVTGGLAGLGHILTGRVFATWLPVYFGSLWADHAVFGPDPYVFHLGNLLLHVLNALLVLWIARRLGFGREVSFGAAFLFALHPAAVQSVAWISERKGLLAFLFSGFSILGFLRGVESEGRRRLLGHGLGLLFLFLALLSKGSALALPPILAVLVIALRPGGRRRLLDVAPYFVVAGVLAVVHYSIARDEGTALATGGPGFGELLVANLTVIGGYLRLLVLPFWGQSAVHDVPAGEGFPASAALGAAGLLLLLASLVIAWRRDRRIFFALAAAVLALAPFNNILPRTTVLFAERYLYLSLLGGSLFLAALVGRLLGGRPAAVRRAALAAVVVLFGVFLALRARVWSDPVTLFADAAEKSGGAWLAQMKLGEALSERAQRPGEDGAVWSRAAAAFRRAVENATTALDEVRARANLSGVLLAVGGREEEVLDVVRAADARLADLGEEEREALGFHLSVNRGTALAALDRPEEAVEAYRAAARARPLDPAPLTALVGALLAAGRPEEALEAGREATRLVPGNETAALVLSQALLATGDVGESRRVLETVIERNPEAAGALAFLGRIELASSRPRAAREKFAAAIAVRPDLDSAKRGLAEAEVLVARSRLVVGKREEARSAAARAMEADPENPEAVWILGWATEDPEEADALLLRASRMAGGERARGLLARHRLSHAVARFDAGEAGAAEDLAAGALRAGADILTGTSDLRIPGDLPRLAALAAEGPAGRHAALLGTALVFAEGREDEGEELLGRAVARAGDAGEFDGAVVRAALYVRGRSRLSRKNARGAREDFSVLLDLRADDVPAAEGLAEALYHVAVTRQTEGKEAGETFEAARAAAERALKLRPGSLPAKLTAGRVAFATGNSMESLKLFLGAKREHPGRVEPMLALAGQYRATYQMTGEKRYLTRAREELEAAVETDPRDARARAELGQVLLRSGEAAEASRQLQLAIAEDPGLTSAREDLAGLYVRAGRAQLEQGGPDGRERAADLAQRALALEVETAGPYLLVAELHRIERDYAPAQEALEEAARISPDSAEVKDALAAFYKDLGYALLLRRERGRAVEAFERALAAGSETVDLDPVRLFLSGADEEPAPEPDPEVARILAEKGEKARAFFEEAGEKLEAGDLGGAEEAILRSIATFSTGEGWYRLGRVREAQRDREEAIRAYANAVKEKPSLSPAWLALGTARYFRGEWRGALEAYEGYLAVAGDDTPEETRVMIEERVGELRRTIDEEKR